MKRFFASWFPRQEFRVDGEPSPRMIKWTLLSTPVGMVFLHKFLGPDWTRDPHDHPAYFVSIGLWGSYIESVYDRDGQELYERKWRAPWVRMFPPTHIHRTSWVSPHRAYTICLTGKWVHQWGFMLGNQSVAWRDYVKRYRSARSDRDAA